MSMRARTDKRNKRVRHKRNIETRLAHAEKVAAAQKKPAAAK